MIRTVFKSIFFFTVFLCGSIFSVAQTTVNFNSYTENQGLSNPHTEGELKFEVIKNTSLCTVCIGIDFNEGKDGTPGLDDDNFEINGIVGWKISKADNSSFQFLSIWLQHRGAGTSTSGTIKAFKGGLQVGSTVNINFDSNSAGLKSFSSNPDFYDVDEVRIEGIDLYIILDEITYGAPFIVGDADPAEVTGINLIGAHLSTATSVQYQVDFSKIAKNVSADDFTLTTTGTAIGTIGTVTGSNATYTVPITGISGEGTLRLDLKAGTNIANENDVTGTAAFTSGQIHNVSPCLVEDFEDETVGTKVFSYGGFDFVITGNMEVHTEIPVSGINGSRNVLNNTGVGPYTLSSNSGEINLRRIALYLSSIADGSSSTNDGTITIVGKNGGANVYTISKISGFPTDFSSNSGYYILDLKTEGGVDNSIKSVDEIEITIGGAFQYLNIDNFEFCADDVAPSGYTVSIDQDPITQDNENAVSFTFAAAEIGSTYDYTFTSSGGGTPVTGTGTILTATDQITGINLSGLGVGLVNLSVSLTDASNNKGLPATANVQKRINTAPVATPPTAPVVMEDITVALSDDIQVSDNEGDDQTVTFTVTGGTVTLGTTDITFGGSGNGSANFTASGTLAAINTALDAATFTSTPNLFGTNAGTISFISNDGSDDSNVASITFNIQPVNDDPTFTGLPASITVLEDASGSSLNGALSNGTFSDIDAGSSSVVLFVTTSSGTFSFANPGGIPVTLAGNVTPTISITGSQAAIEAYISINSNISYNPASNVAGVNAALVTLEANDNGNTGTGGGTRVEIGSFNINITPVNDDPTFVGLPTDISVQNGVASNLDLSSATFGDVDSGSGNVTLGFLVSGGTLSATSTADVAVSFPIPGAMNLVGTAAAIEAFLNTPSNIKYTNAPGSTGDNAATLSVSANDNGNTGTGGGVPVNFGTINIDVVTPIPSVTLSSVTIAQGESVADPVVITATLSNSFGSDVIVNLGFSGTATGSGVDYSRSGTSITITAGNTTGSITLTNVSDALYEGNETVIIDISGVTNGTEDGVQQLTYTIVDDDPQPTVTLEVLNIYNPITDESGGQAYVRAILDVVAGTTVTVPLSFSGTAIGGGTDYSITGSTITLSSGQTMDSIRVTSLFDGIEEGNETIIVDMGTPTNAAKGTPNQVTITIIDEDSSPPAGYSVSIDQSAINSSNETAASFTFAGAEVGAIYNYQFSSSGGGTAVSGSGTIANASDQITGIDLSGLGDGIITLSATLEDAIGNVGSPATDTKNKDTVDPSGYAVSIDLLGETQINSINQTIIEFTGTGLETGATLSYSFTSDGGGTPVSGSELVTSANQTFSNGGAGYDLSGLSDGLVTLTVYLTDPAGNQGGNATNTANKDVGAPTGYSVTWDDALINASEASNTSFTLSNGEIGATAFYSISSSGDGNTATVSGTTLVTNNSQAISVNVSSLVDGTLTVSVYLKDGSGNNGATVSDNSALLDQTPPPAPSVPDLSAASDSGISDSDDITNDVTPTFVGTAIPNSIVTLTSNIDGNVGSTTANGSGDWSITSSTLSSGIHSISASATDLADNTSAASAGIQVTIDILAPTPILINGLALQLDVNGNAPTITAADLLATTITDDYSSSGNIQLVVDKSDFDCSNVGNNNITVTATDEAGNSDFASTNVVVQDLIGPTILAKAAITLNVDAFGTVNLTPAMVDEGSTDACGILSQTFSQSVFDRTDEGVNNVIYTVTDVNGNPSQVPLEVTVVVVPKVLNITVDAGQSKVYGDANPVYTFTATGFEAGDDETILTGALTRLAGENVGTYAIQLGTLDAGPNYSINFTPANFGITPASLNVTANPGQTKIYGNADPALTYQVTGFKNGDGLSVFTGSLARATGENVGSYAINIGTLSAGINYTINFTGADFTITPRIMNIVANPNQAKVYGSADPVLTYTASNFGNGDNNSILTGALSREFGEKKGKYAILLGSLSAGSNYTINFTSDTFTIAAKVLDVTADAGQSKVFGTADPVLTYQVSGFENGDDASILSGALARAAGENVGTYAINLGTLDAGFNYAINYTGVDFTISKANITGITFVDGSFVYDGTAKSLAITGTLPTGVSVSYANNSRTDVGTQEATATIFGSNYNQFVLKADLTITPGSITGISFEDESFVYDGTAKSLEITGTLPAGASVTYTNNSRTDVGSQEVMATISSSNFTSFDLTADLSITPATLDIVADPDQNKLFGESDPELTYSASGFGAGDDESILTGSLERASGESVGMYSILLGSLDAGSNYTIDFTGADFEIISNDSDGDGVPDDVENEQGTDPDDPMDYQDEDGDDVPDFVEDEQGTDPMDSGDYLDSDGDDVPDYIEEQQGTDPDDPTDFPDEDGDGIPDYVADKAVAEFVVQSLEVLWGTLESELKVPVDVVGITSNGTVINFPVVWDLTGYNPLILATTNFFGAVELPAGVFNPDGLQPVLELTVLAKPAPTDVTLSASSFIAIPDVFFQEIGVFTVIDPSDDQHTMSLPEGSQDNEYFEVIDGILFWSSAEQAQGRTDFNILLRVVDRAGNVLEKSFQITRNRTPLDQLELTNTFTPNNDGVNDTWGVPALRYYQGVRISILEVGGNRVFYTENPDIRWDGTFDGKDLPVGAYFWIIEVEETGEIRRGVLNLLRQ